LRKYIVLMKPADELQQTAQPRGKALFNSARLF
jgi:hypothetical protein